MNYARAWWPRCPEQRTKLAFYDVLRAATRGVMSVGPNLQLGLAYLISGELPGRGYKVLPWPQPQQQIGRDGRGYLYSSESFRALRNLPLTQRLGVLAAATPETKYVSLSKWLKTAGPDDKKLMNALIDKHLPLLSSRDPSLLD